MIYFKTTEYKGEDIGTTVLELRCCDICSTTPANTYLILREHRIIPNGKEEIVYENKDLCEKHAHDLHEIIIKLWKIDSV